MKTKIIETTNYQELARRVGDMIMINEIVRFAGDKLSELEIYNGDLYETDEENEDYTEIYQYFAITKSGADYLKRNTNEIVFYNEDLDTYFWGITHFGTPWCGVDVNLIEKEEENND